MHNRAKATAKTIWKYLAWTAIAAVIQTAIDCLPGWNLPVLWIPIIAAALKGAATWVATQRDAWRP